MFLLCFLHPRCAPPGSSRVADAAELSVSEAADSSGGVHLLSDALWWKRPLFDLSGPHQLHREERDPLLPAEEPDQAERWRSAVTAGTWDLGPVSNRFFIGWFWYLENKLAYIQFNADKLYNLFTITDWKLTLMITSRNAEIKSTLILQNKWKSKKTKKKYFIRLFLGL